MMQSSTVLVGGTIIKPKGTVLEQVNNGNGNSIRTDADISFGGAVFAGLGPHVLEHRPMELSQFQIVEELRARHAVPARLP